MELDELKAAWRELDRRIDDGLAINHRVLGELKRDKAQSAMRRLTVLLVFEIASGLLATLLLGSFLADHLDVARFAVPTVVLHVVAVFTIATAARQLVMVLRLDYAAPVIALQRELAELRASRVRNVRWLLLLSPLLWTPLAIVGGQGLFGLDVYQRFGVPWVLANLGFGVVMIPLTIGIARLFADQLGGSRIIGHLADDLAGRSLATAKGHLDEVARFEAEG